MATVTYNPTYKEEKKKYSVKMPVGLIGTKDYEKAVERARTEAYVKNSNPSIKNTSNMSDADLNTYRYRATAMGQNGQEDYIDEVTGNPITAEEIQNKVAGTLAENYYPTNRQKQIESNVYNGTYTPSATDTFKDVYSYRVQNPSNGMKLQTYGTNGMQTSVPNAVNNPYQSQISNVQKAYEEMLRKQNRANDLAVEQGVNEYQSQKDSVNQNYDGMARDAYVTMMMGQKNMPQQLAANGIRGGGTETANLGLQTAYQNNLNSVEQNRANDIKSIDNAILQLQNQGDLNATQNALDIQQQQLNAYMQLMDKSTNYDLSQQEQYKQDYANTATGYADDYQAQINSLLAQGYSPDSYEVKVLKTLREQKIQGQAQAQAQAQADALKQANLDRNYNLDYMKTMYDVNKPYPTPDPIDNTVPYKTQLDIINGRFRTLDANGNPIGYNENTTQNYIENEYNSGRLSDKDRITLYNMTGVYKPLSSIEKKQYQEGVASAMLQRGAKPEDILVYLNRINDKDLVNMYSQL